MCRAAVYCGGNAARKPIGNDPKNERAITLYHNKLLLLYLTLQRHQDNIENFILYRGHPILDGLLFRYEFNNVNPRQSCIFGHVKFKGEGHGGFCMTKKKKKPIVLLLSWLYQFSIICIVYKCIKIPCLYYNFRGASMLPLQCVSILLREIYWSPRMCTIRSIRLCPDNPYDI